MLGQYRPSGDFWICIIHVPINILDISHYVG